MTTTTKSLAPSSVLGFDFGLKKIGIATGQTITKTASPIGIIRVENGELPLVELNKLLKIWKPDALVVGIPLNMDDTLSPISLSAEEFAKNLELTTNLPVYRVDERLSTRNARYELEALEERTKVKRKDHRLDAFAACLIIETWLQNN